MGHHDSAKPHRGTALIALLLSLGCSHPGTTTPASSVSPRGERAERPEEDPPSEPSPTEVADAEPSRPAPVVLIDQPATLESLGLAFGPTVLGIDDDSTLAMRKSRAFRELAAALRENADIPGWWLRSEHTAFEVAAVANRLDRMDVLPGTCGESRVVYRLVRRADDGSRETLPVALSALFEQPQGPGGCADVAQAWQTDAAEKLADGGGPLSPQVLSRARLRAVESNVRTRFRDDPPHNVLSIHIPAESPRWDEPTWTAGMLEFAPWSWYKGRGWSRVTELLSAPAMRQSVFEGTVMTTSLSDLGLVPEDVRGWHSWESTRMSPLGRAETMLPEDSDYAPFEGREAFVERARSLSCAGCHSTRSVDGFHVALESSAHLQDDSVWRRAYVEAIAEGREPNRTRPSVYGDE